MVQERNVMQRSQDLEGTERKNLYQSSRTGDRPTDVDASNIWLPLGGSWGKKEYFDYTFFILSATADDILRQ
jgi:hypothetical protein